MRHRTRGQARIPHIRPPNPVAKAMLSDPQFTRRYTPTRKTQRAQEERQRPSQHALRMQIDG